MGEFVQIKNLSLKYQSPEGEVEALRDVSFSIKSGEFISIIGPSGCGKSTLLSVISGLLPASGGKVLVGGEAVGSGRHFSGYMLQKDNLFEWRSILQNVLLGLEIRGIKTPQNIAFAKELLHTYGLEEFSESFPSALSGGMRQRCALIRTLAARPDLLLLDEAFSALDYQTRLSVANDIYTILRREQKTVLIVTHDISEAISLSDRVVILTRRPGSVKSIIPIIFSKAGLSPLDRREQPEFPAYFNQIWREIDVHLT